MERGKPHERETQILVGESLMTNMKESKDRKIDKCLPPFMVQNMAY